MEGFEVKLNRDLNKNELLIIRKGKGREVGSGRQTHNQNQRCELTFIPIHRACNANPLTKLPAHSSGSTVGCYTKPVQPAIQSEKRKGGGNDPGMVEVGGISDGILCAPIRPKPGVQPVSSKILLIAFKAVRASQNLTETFADFVLGGPQFSFSGRFWLAGKRAWLVLYTLQAFSNLGSPKLYAHVLQRGFGRRQAIPALQLASPRQHHHPARGLSLRARREAARVALTIQKFFPRAALRVATDSNQRVAHEPHELFGSSTTCHAAALYRVDCIEIDPASGTQLAPFPRGFCRRQAKAAPPDSKHRLSAFPHELFSSSRTRRAAAHSFHYIEIVPARDTLSAFSPGIRPPLLQTQCDVSRLKLPRCVAHHQGAAKLRQSFEYIDFFPASGVSDHALVSCFKYSPSRIPDVFGNSIFRRPASEFRDEANQRPALKFDLSGSGELELQDPQVPVLSLLPSAIVLQIKWIPFRPPKFKSAQTAYFNLSAIRLGVQNIKFHSESPTWWIFASQTDFDASKRVN
ncbi:hypothetical protein R3P38DRAFT_3582088 [Favolaschia claudopus]|uniref:Uncharacterized protein n=1 Tax=Favolaschia claudopus TaxID=2862362 RepID=A0AAW0AJZ6_9AGAR